ncbi:MAG: hypothetical protein FJZ07_02150 [Candidatus Nealsonbacteria bacterium]|nr:hypothetical protein [Candidatus Nealsonbacteria bacterium]
MTSTQDFLEFDQIKEGIIILKNKGLRAVLMVSPSNFALKSTDEQNAILYQFQNFLNSLDFSCQILVQSRRLNITGYLEKLEEIEKKEKDDLLQLQISEYRKFIDQIMKGGTIMQKMFYVIIPFSIMEAQTMGGTGKGIKIPVLSEEVFQRCKAQLYQRMEFAILGLRSCGLEAVPLNNLELTEFLWSLHHPIEAERGYYPEIPGELIE